jgi:hypothetical protein
MERWGNGEMERWRDKEERQRDHMTGETVMNYPSHPDISSETN